MSGALVPKKPPNVSLPAILDKSDQLISDLVSQLQIPREVLASKDQIENAWGQLPKILSKIPVPLRKEEFMRMCVAVANGLFDSGLNYIWNATIACLRAKVKSYGLPVVGQLKQQAFEEKHLFELLDANLLELCLELNLITEEGSFFLDQCRDVRNNYSAAHPSPTMIDEYEFVTFFNRCVKYALETQATPIGVDVSALLAALKKARFVGDQLKKWEFDFKATHDAQRRIIFGMLHGIYCDPASAEEARLNCADLLASCKDKFTLQIQSDLIDQHQSYVAKGDTVRHSASRTLFEKLSLLGLLGEAERHAIISHACKRLSDAHEGFNNFHHEPPFADRLAQLAKQGAIPQSAQPEFVRTVIDCALGNQYGHSWGADYDYKMMVKGFSPNEVRLMFELVESDKFVKHKIESYPKCKARFSELVAMIEKGSVPTAVRALYLKWVAK